ncbi:MAG TPA: hypothetical protein VKU82_10720, partial [Planctomycetaceae bacterium]|nr:hypothetical protein [Planctomycetaceae bacterium]
RDGLVYVARRPRNTANCGEYLRRLAQGLAHDVSLVQAKSILGLRRSGADWPFIIGEISQFGSRNHDRWGEGMTLLAIAANLLPELRPETAYQLVLRAGRQVGADCSDAPARREREPLADATHSPERLTRWLRAWVRARHRDAGERVLLTAIARLETPAALAELVFTAAGDRIYAQIGHVFDGWNKAFELLDLVGWKHASAVLPLVIAPTVSARGAEEDAHWHHPQELIEPLRAAETELPALLRTGSSRSCDGAGDLLPVLLGDDPLAIIEVLKQKLAGGVSAQVLAQRVAYAAAVRLARFSTNNEVADWFNPRHTFIFACAVHQAVKRSPAPGIVRGVFHAALAVYMDRFLNVPPARFAGDPRKLGALPTDIEGLRHGLLSCLDQQSNVDEAALIVARWLRVGQPYSELVDLLAHATVREDLDFHALQVLEAAVRQCRDWGPGRECELIMIAVVRQLAAFCPTPRAAHRIATTALRLERGDKMYEETPG